MSKKRIATIRLTSDKRVIPHIRVVDIVRRSSKTIGEQNSKSRRKVSDGWMGFDAISEKKYIRSKDKHFKTNKKGWVSSDIRRNKYFASNTKKPK